MDEAWRVLAIKLVNKIDADNHVGDYWTIMEKDVGGMLGGYPRWLDDDGHYSATDPNEFKKFNSKEEVEKSADWAKVKGNSGYIIDAYRTHPANKQVWDLRDENASLHRYLKLALGIVDPVPEIQADLSDPKWVEKNADDLRKYFNILPTGA